MNTSTVEKMYGVSGKTEPAHWRDDARFCMHALEADLRRQGLTPKRAPEIPPEGSGVEAVAEGPYRLLCQFVPFPIVGYEQDEHGEPLRDDEGELQYLYGEPCFYVRVDTIVDAPL